MRRLFLPNSIRAKLFLALLAVNLIVALLGGWSIFAADSFGRIMVDPVDRPMLAVDQVRRAASLFAQLENLPSTAPEASVTALKQSLIQTLALVEARATEDGLAGRGAILQARALAWWFSLIAAIVALLLSAGTAFFLFRGVVRPLAAATAVAERISAGDFETPIPLGGRDETGIFLRSLGVMQARIRKMMLEEASSRRSAQGRLIEALESSPEAMLLLDRDNQIIIANSRVAELLGDLADPVKDGMPFQAIFARDGVLWASQLGAPGEVVLPDGSWLHVSREETVAGGAFLIWSEITLRKTYERKLEMAAYEDHLTGARTRSFLHAQMDQDGLAGLPIEGTALLIVNIDQFRQINNVHGLRVGDAVLHAVAERLLALLTPDDVCARTDGDEFVLWQRQSEKPGVPPLIESVIGAFGPPIRLVDRVLSVRMSIGMARADQNTPSRYDLLREARAALDQAKRLGGGRVEVFTDRLRQSIADRLRIEQDLLGAIYDRQLYIEYQPLVHLATGQIGGFEALSRWCHPVLGQIPPSRFIPIAEETGGIIELGRYVLHEAAAQAEAWFKDLDLAANFTIAVNLSPRQIADPWQAREILDYLDQHPEATPRLKLEITEGVLLENPVAMQELLSEFKRRGVSLSLDDFGTGYSSLSYLHKFPFDVLKIDRSFVMGISESPEALRLVKTIIELSQDLGLEVVAEGVETADQAQRLKALGCTYAQGYFYSRPMNPEAASALLASKPAWI